MALACQVATQEGHWLAPPTHHLQLFWTTEGLYPCASIHVDQQPLLAAPDAAAGGPHVVGPGPCVLQLVRRLPGRVSVGTACDCQQAQHATRRQAQHVTVSGSARWQNMWQVSTWRSGGLLDMTCRQAKVFWPNAGRTEVWAGCWV